MPQTANQIQFTTNKLPCLYRQDAAVELPVNLAPSTVFPRGTVLGLITGSANDVQTLTGTATGGTATLTGTNPVTGLPFTTASFAFNASAATIAAAVQAALGGMGGTITGTGGALGTAGVVLTAGGTLALLPVPLLALGAGSALTGGTITFAHTTIGRTANTYAAYATGNSDGSQTAKCVLPWPCATDASGGITLGAAATGDFWGGTLIAVAAYFKGVFDTTQLVGLDATAVGQLGRLWSGTAAAGVLEIQ